MSTTTLPHPSTNGSSKPHPQHSDRDANGRFIKGNPGGVGNPFGREVAGLRRALVGRLTTEKMEMLADKLISCAIAGNWVAAKLVLSYVLGKPAEAVDPDKVDLQEWDLFKRQATIPAEAPGLLMTPEPVFSLDLIRTMRPLNNRTMVKDLSAGLKEQRDEEQRETKREQKCRERRRQKRDAKRRQTMSTATGEADPESPSTNGVSSDTRCQLLPIVPVDDAPLQDMAQEANPVDESCVIPAQSMVQPSEEFGMESPSTIGVSSDNPCQTPPNMTESEAQNLLQKIMGKLWPLGGLPGGESSSAPPE